MHRVYRAQARDSIADQPLFATTVLDDFDLLRDEDLEHPEMKKIEALLKVASGRGAIPAKSGK
jgi:hypothetical protein